MSRILFVRHGHSLSQLQTEVVTGRCPEFPLSDKGRGQAKLVASRLEAYSISQMFSSPCKRTIETSDLISKQLGIPYTVEEALTERSQGDFEMKPKDAVYTPETIKAIHADQFRWAPPGGESLENVGLRLTTFLQNLSSTEEDSCYLCVSHLMLLWSLFYLATKCDHRILPRLKVENCGLVEVDFNAPDSFQLLRWNHSQG